MIRYCCVVNVVSRERASIFRITHVDNVPWVLRYGLHCRNCDCCDPNYHEIGNTELIGRRAERRVPIAPGGTLSDYVPFYFTPHSPMLYNIKTGHGGVQRRPMSDIVILTTSLHRVADAGCRFVFTDRHAYLAAAQFFDNTRDLEYVDWQALQARDFRRDPNNLAKFERYQAEALIHRHLPVAALADLVCHGEAQRKYLESLVRDADVPINIRVDPKLYF